MALDQATVLALLEQATRTPPGRLRPETPLASLAGWDSLGLVQLMASISDAGGAEFQVAELRAPVTVGGLLELVAGRERSA